uniref:Uncharacterized protein n=1 Tax=Candidatus Methanogaster sp. ANME-2c ERB4 TaxID=2759911 RepID=A0A7G9YHZ7_9EURY|nr:hypothetical protein PGBELJNO_00029 [Methanosarcinales archaeon ANME-2c ERB4]
MNAANLSTSRLMLLDVLHTFCTEAYRERCYDLNEEGVTTADAVIVLQMVASGERSGAADVNRSGAVTSVDALIIR